MLVYGKCECFVMQMFVSCVHPVVVLNAVLGMTFSLLMRMQEGTIWKRKTPEPVSDLKRNRSAEECQNY